MTPMQEQYKALKEEYKDTILLFRLGDFYETFDQDAELVSKVLGITLTGRGKNENRVPMAGIPYHALPNYMPKLINAGLKIAIADQMEEATPGKIVERKVTKIITAGTIIDENLLEDSKNNFIASIFKDQKNKTGAQFLLSYCDITTGEFKGFRANSVQALKNEIEKINPAEILVASNQVAEFQSLHNRLEPLEHSYFDLKVNFELLCTQLKLKNLKGFGINDEDQIISPAGALIQYLKRCRKSEISHIQNLKLYSYSDVMQLDFETIRNLELVFSMNPGSKSTTLFDVLNECKNPMGQRKLRNWILNPLKNAELINQRYQKVDVFFKERMLTSNIREIVKSTIDMERVIGKIGVGTANPRDLVALSSSIKGLHKLFDLISEDQNFREFNEKYKDTKESLEKLVDLIDSAIDEEPSVALNQGGIIKNGFNQEVDELRKLSNGSKEILGEIQAREVKRSGISSLKISFNNVFGYYIEITRSNLDKVPSDYIRKQTLANAERYITEELKELEVKILNAEEKLIKLEAALFLELRNNAATYIPQLQLVSDLVSEVDVLSTLGEIARENRYVKPLISKNFNIKNGRHPVVEKLVKEFTPNNSDLTNSSINIITGPNMSGKSTYIRQVALLSLISQIGSFVPADSMETTVLDRIFTRVGAGDNLTKGESTFMVEMTETANILNNATENSLIILDEVGRGTSTYDGVAIAWSIVEYIQKEIRAKTLFATHYHELTQLEEMYAEIKNYNVKVLEANGEILFTHKIESGSAGKSYGVHVANLAGIPKPVITRADEILSKFENSSKDSTKSHQISGPHPKLPKKIHPEQLGLI